MSLLLSLQIFHFISGNNKEISQLILAGSMHFSTFFITTLFANPFTNSTNWELPNNKNTREKKEIYRILV